MPWLFVLAPPAAAFVGFVWLVCSAVRAERRAYREAERLVEVIKLLEQHPVIEPRRVRSMPRERGVRGYQRRTK